MTSWTQAGIADMMYHFSSHTLSNRFAMSALKAGSAAPPDKSAAWRLKRCHEQRPAKPLQAG
jgi:hypothetical protein